MTLSHPYKPRIHPRHGADDAGLVCAGALLLPLLPLAAAARRFFFAP
jgi:hypothetical protein